MAKQEQVPAHVELRHRKGCTGKDNTLDPSCTCVPNIRGAVYIDSKKKTHGVKGRRPAPDRCAEAHRWAIKAKELATTGRVLQLESHTIEASWRDWLAQATSGRILSNREKHYAKSTLVRWECGMRVHTLPAIGHLDIKALTPKRLRDLVTDLRIEADLGGQAARNCIVPLSTMYRWAVEEDMVEINPCLGVRLPAYQPKEIEVPTFEQQDAMLTAAAHADGGVLWALALYAGARRGEALGLQWDMIDLDGSRWGVPSMKFTRTWNPDVGIWEYKEDVKTRAGNRPVPMVGPLAKILREHRAATGRLAGFVFSQNADEPWDGNWQTFYRTVRQEIALEGLPKLTFHDLRHVYASRIIRATVESGENVDWNEVAQLMGHTSVAFTIDTYAHMVPDYLERHRKYQDDYYRRNSG